MQSPGAFHSSWSPRAGHRSGGIRTLRRPRRTTSHSPRRTIEPVDAFYRAGLSNGGRNNGPPAPRKSSTRCYAAFLIDPDGNNVEASYRDLGVAPNR